MGFKEAKTTRICSTILGKGNCGERRKTRKKKGGSEGVGEEGGGH